MCVCVCESESESEVVVDATRKYSSCGSCSPCTSVGHGKLDFSISIQTRPSLGPPRSLPAGLLPTHVLYRIQRLLVPRLLSSGLPSGLWLLDPTIYQVSSFKSLCLPRCFSSFDFIPATKQPNPQSCPQVKAVSAPTP